MAFKRLIELSVGLPGGFGVLIRGNRITFEVKKTDANSENTCEIEIFNLSDTTISQIAKRDYFVSLRAGYEDEGAINNVFFGDITGILVFKDGPDKILQLQVTDGYTALKNKPVSISYKPGTPAIQIINELISIINLPLATPFDFNLEYVTGFSYFGRVQDALTQILSFGGFTWSIINNHIFIYDPVDPEPQPQVYKLSPTSGLIGFPELLKETDTVFDLNENVDFVKYRIKSVMVPQIIPGSKVEMESISANGLFIVETVKYKGDNWDGDFINLMDIKGAA